MRHYANTRLNSALMDARRSIPPHIVLDFGNRGLLGLQVPKESGGLDLNYTDCMAVMSQIGAIDLNLAIFVGLHNYLGIRPIMHFSQPEVREELLPRLANGRELAAFGLTEPGAGSNASAIEGTAVQLSNGKVRLNGSKIWIGNASWAGVINVFLRYYGEDGKPHGICGYALRQGQQGLEMGPELMTTGLRGMVQNRFALRNAEIDPVNQLGELGHGMVVAQDAMMYTRLALGAIFLGAMKRSMQLMLRYADRRKNVSSGRLLDNPVSIMRLSTLTAKAQVLENLVHFISRGLDESLDMPEEFLITAKVSGSEFLWDAVDDASQMLGGRGYLDNNEIAKIMRDARVGRIFEGPTETMMYYMGSRFALDYSRLTEFLTAHLDAGDIAGQMLEAREIVAARCKALDAPFGGMRRLHLANSLLGEIVHWGVLHAVTRHIENPALADHSRVKTWVEGRFREAIQSATGSSLAEKTSIEPAELKFLVASYEAHIGDMEQTLPGEEWELDPYLRITAAN